MMAFVATLPKQPLEEMLCYRHYGQKGRTMNTIRIVPKTMYSELFEEEVQLIHEKHDRPYINCFRCGKLLKDFTVVVSVKDGTEMAYFGDECIKHFC